ncbi:MAG: DUF899 family protein [Acidobacteriota bacterium]|nr:DUF899 family protein [Acidobacteriota bacterium]
MTDLPQIVYQAGWYDRLQGSYVTNSKEFRYARHALNARARFLPSAKFDRCYEFEITNEEATLLGLFEERRQWIVRRLWR